MYVAVCCSAFLRWARYTWSSESWWNNLELLPYTVNQIWAGSSRLVTCVRTEYPNFVSTMLAHEADDSVIVWCNLRQAYFLVRIFSAILAPYIMMPIIAVLEPLRYFIKRNLPNYWQQQYGDTYEEAYPGRFLRPIDKKLKNFLWLHDYSRFRNKAFWVML